MSYPFRKIEEKWRRRWEEEGIYEPDLQNAKKPFYNLMMFPYPSAEGLHVGNMYAFTGSDVYGRYKRMQGYDVFEPIGLDGFGIHSENYALKVGTHPARQAKKSQENFYRQLQEIGNGFSWKEKLETYDPRYYRWTQWIFVQMFKRGLAYRKKQAVNWCGSCKTVLADEQVIGGKCERCDHQVSRRELEQWFFRITNYAERLLRDLEKLDWSEVIKVAQRNWIGKSEGAEITFPLTAEGHSLTVFTTRPDTLFGVTYLVCAPEHPILSDLRSYIENWEELEGYQKKARAMSYEERIAEGRKKTGVELRGIRARHPITGVELPVWVADYVLAEVGTGAVMAVPAHDTRDYEFANVFHLPIKEVIRPPDGEKDMKRGAYTGSGVLVNSGKFSGKNSEDVKWDIAAAAGGKRVTRYRLRDWLISRQRYWGPPIPMIYCEQCAATGKGERAEMPGWYSVPPEELPVLLPYVEEFRPTGKGVSPLAAVPEFYRVPCPSCGAEAVRETDVSDTFLDSSWYYLGYLIYRNDNFTFDKKLVERWLPVDMYIGGKEHAVLHLLYVRFIAKVLHEWGIVHFDEPAVRFRAHGLLIRNGAKISKSRGNIVNPDEFIRKFGADAFRMHLMFLGPFEEGGDFRDAGIMGPVRFLDRVWVFAQKVAKNGAAATDIEALRALHKAILQVTRDIEQLHYNTAISALMRTLTIFERHTVAAEDFLTFLKLLAPFAPYITEELWREHLQQQGSIHRATWPSYREEFVREEKVKVVVQVDGKVRAVLEVKPGLSQKELLAKALADEKIRARLAGGKPARVIYVQDKVLNLLTTANH